MIGAGIDASVHAACRCGFGIRQFQQLLTVLIRLQTKACSTGNLARSRARLYPAPARRAGGGADDHDPDSFRGPGPGVAAFRRGSRPHQAELLRGLLDESG